MTVCRIYQFGGSILWTVVKLVALTTYTVIFIVQFLHLWLERRYAARPKLQLGSTRVDLFWLGLGDILSLQIVDTHLSSSHIKASAQLGLAFADLLWKPMRSLLAKWTLKQDFLGIQRRIWAVPFSEVVDGVFFAANFGFGLKETLLEKFVGADWLCIALLLENIHLLLLLILKALKLGNGEIWKWFLRSCGHNVYYLLRIVLAVGDNLTGGLCKRTHGWERYHSHLVGFGRTALGAWHVVWVVKQVVDHRILLMRAD